MKSKQQFAVSVQKGHIVANPMTIGQMPYHERTAEARQKVEKLKDGATLKLHTPDGKRKK